MKALFLGNVAADTANGIKDELPPQLQVEIIADPKTPGLDVNVDTRGGKVTLFGMVPTQEAKLAAEEDARKVSGVKADSLSYPERPT